MTPAGIPIPKELCCCNSGLSLVNVDRIVRLLKAFPRRTSSWDRNADIFMLSLYPFEKTFKRRNLTFRIAHRDSGMAFSAETMWRGPDAPFGLHKPWLHMPNAELRGLSRTCPELRRLCGLALADSDHSHADLLNEKIVDLLPVGNFMPGFCKTIRKNADMSRAGCPPPRACPPTC